MSGQRQNKKLRQAKVKVLQARIPEDLDEELRDRASSLGLSVSTLVRNVLMHSFDLVEDVVTDSTRLARTAGMNKEPQPSAPTDGRQQAPVVAWQAAALNLNAVCDHCNTILHKGQQAAVGIPISHRPAILCLDCLADLDSAHDPDFAGD
jgi:hypothetical protein